MSARVLLCCFSLAALGLAAAAAEPDHHSHSHPFTVTFNQFHPSPTQSVAIESYFQGGCASDGTCWQGTPAGGVGLSGPDWTVIPWFFNPRVSMMAPTSEIDSEGGFTGYVTLAYVNSWGDTSSIPWTMPVEVWGHKDQPLASMILDFPQGPGIGQTRTLHFHGRGYSLRFPALSRRFNFVSIQFANVRPGPASSNDESADELPTN